MKNYIVEPRQEIAGDFFMGNYKRRFSLEDDFMNYNTDDLLYGSMCYLATFHPVERKLYLTKKNFTKNKKTIYAFCDLNAQSLKRHLGKMIKDNLVAEEDIQVGDEIYPSYVFPYDYNGNYQLIENEMLWYIISTRNKQAVRVYVYLLNCFKWKAKSDEDFIFTNKDVMKAIGYSANSNNALASSAVSNILESFNREGIIEIEDFYEEKVLSDGASVPTPKKRLKFVASSKSEIK